jgi:hypothetical protein
MHDRVVPQMNLWSRISAAIYSSYEPRSGSQDVYPYLNDEMPMEVSDDQ